MANPLWKLDKNKSDNLDKKIIADILKIKRMPAIFFCWILSNIFSSEHNTAFTAFFCSGLNRNKKAERIL